jgi:hypothetical protein
MTAGERDEENFRDWRRVLAADYGVEPNDTPYEAPALLAEAIGRETVRKFALEWAEKYGIPTLNEFVGRW